MTGQILVVTPVADQFVLRVVRRTIKYPVQRAFYPELDPEFFLITFAIIRIGVSKNTRLSRTFR